MFNKNEREVTISKSEYHAVNFMFMVCGISFGVILGYIMFVILNIR